MTEQEKREKAIEEMVYYGGKCTLLTGWYNCKSCKYRPCVAFEYCENLYDASYRKEEEVQKKTAKKIIKYLREHGHFAFDYPDDPVRNVSFSESIFEVLEDMFGVEVE